MLIGGSVILLIIGAPAIADIAWATLPPIVWIALAYLAFVTTGGTMFLVQYAAMRIPASKVMAYTYLTPSFVILWEIAFGGALPPVALLGGIALTVLALLFLLRA